MGWGGGGMCVSKSARLIMMWGRGGGRKYASQMPLGYFIVGREFMSVIRLKDADLSKTQPCKYFVYMIRGNPSQD